MGANVGFASWQNLKLLAVRPEGNSPLLPQLDIEHAFKVIRHYLNGQFSPLQPTFNALDIGTPTALNTGKRSLHHTPYVVGIQPFFRVFRIRPEGDLPCRIAFRSTLGICLESNERPPFLV